MDSKYIGLMGRLWSGTATEEDIQFYKTNLMSEEEKAIGKPVFEMDDNEAVDFKVLCYNNQQGNKQGYECPKCKNRGDIAVNKDGNFALRQCECLAVRHTLQLVSNSGLGDLLSICKFDNYKCEHKWQHVIKQKAKDFIADKYSNLFYIGGNSGTGKTHICTAIAGELIKQGMPVKYMAWLEDSIALKQSINDSTEYNRLMQQIKNTQVLFIDDFLKTGKNEEPTQADIKLAMEIINYRCIQARLDKDKRYITIICSERSVGELISYDEAMGSRIVGVAKDYCLFVARDINKNYRLKKYFQN